RTVHEHALTGLEPAVHEEPLPGRESRDGEARADGEVDVAGQRREVARLNHDRFGERAVAVPRGEPEHPLADRQTARAVSERTHDAGHLVPGDRGRAVAAEVIDPGARPAELTRGESGCVHLDEHVVATRGGVGPLGECHSRGPRGGIRHDDRLHPAPPCLARVDVSHELVPSYSRIGRYRPIRSHAGQRTVRLSMCASAMSIEVPIGATSCAVWASMYPPCTAPISPVASCSTGASGGSTPASRMRPRASASSACQAPNSSYSVRRATS